MRWDYLWSPWGADTGSRETFGITDAPLLPCFFMAPVLSPKPGPGKGLGCACMPPPHPWGATCPPSSLGSPTGPRPLSFPEREGGMIPGFQQPEYWCDLGPWFWGTRMGAAPGVAVLSLPHGPCAPTSGWVRLHREFRAVSNPYRRPGNRGLSSFPRSSREMPCGGCPSRPLKSLHKGPPPGSIGVFRQEHGPGQPGPTLEN